ncbi:alanine racemase [Arenibaculum pallidiluteum]|uniref:alanine racemase n=1 Tax=Arenibaculum pallidiluteum TaxID=2812559 RepID=UPI001A9675B1|nr:alanine racemase [Arenibaculum pallidiluteum]
MAAATPSKNDDVPARAGAILDVDLSAVAANWRLLRDRVRPAACAAVVKADAYGLGAQRVAPALRDAGCRLFFVAHPDEGLALAGAVPAAEIAVLNGAVPGSEGDFSAAGIVPVLNSLDDLARWTRHAATLGRVLPAFIHLDTGMNRLGLAPAEQGTLAAEPERLRGVDLRGWITHLACAEIASHPLNADQAGRFRAALARLPGAPASLANSAGIFLGPDYHFDFVRPGCALYGINPTPGTPNPMLPTIKLRARILQVRPVDSPMTVGYGATHTVVRAGKVATIATGYADGYSRSLSGAGHVLVAGRPAPVIGRVSMDLITVDVTDVPEDAIRQGDFAELIGPHRTVDQVAAEAGTIGYEVMTSLGRRYWRRYLPDGLPA